MTTFKKGDRFIPHKPKENKKSPKWTTRMDEYDNKVLTVEHISPYTGVIHTDDCPFIFHPDWCEKVEDNHVPDVGKTIDWDYWRNEFAKSAMQGLIATGWNIYEVPNLVGKSIEIADEMIKQLK